MYAKTFSFVAKVPTTMHSWWAYVSNNYLLVFDLLSVGKNHEMQVKHGGLLKNQFPVENPLFYRIIAR